MKTIVFVAAMAALTACNQQEAAPAPEATPDAAVATPTAAAEVMAADGKSPVGTYQVTASDGRIFTEEVKADGTYVQTENGAVVETGRWEQKAPNTYCTTKDEEGAEQRCNIESIDDQGVWSSVDPDGKTATVVRVET